MNKLAVTIVLCASAIIVAGCSQESRDEAIERAATAAKTLNGSKNASKGVDDDKVPDIVAEQQRKEKIRQNTQWTAQNQALHPIEYCQAQLEEVSKYSKRLDVLAHEIAVAQSASQRKLSEAEGQVKSLSKFLNDAKALYREADGADQWPMLLNGYQISKEKAQQIIVETYQRQQAAQNMIATQNNMLNKLGAKYQTMLDEQKSLTALRDKIQATISDISMKRLIEGEKGIGDALNSINDSMNALCGRDVSAEPTLDDLLVPTPETLRQEAFDAIMLD